MERSSRAVKDSGERASDLAGEHGRKQQQPEEDCAWAGDLKHAGAGHRGEQQHEEKRVDADIDAEPPTESEGPAAHRCGSPDLSGARDALSNCRGNARFACRYDEAMRVIAGQYRSRGLVAPRGFATRPTSDRLRETLFNVLGPRVEGCVFADLYAGSGGGGNRGAEPRGRAGGVCGGGGAGRYGDPGEPGRAGDRRRLDSRGTQGEGVAAVAG